jgi:serine/threonine protein kinase/Flp pilus assembly protein TadD
LTTPDNNDSGLLANTPPPRTESDRTQTPANSAQDDLARLKPSVPDYELLRVIGRGAYGEVWLARSVLSGYRAIKVVWHRDFAGEDRAFDREFEGIQRFEPISRSRPSQLAILHVGKNAAAGYFYYVMELADPVGNPRVQGREPKADRIPQCETLTAADVARGLPFGAVPDSGLRPEDTYVPHTLREDLKRFGRLPAADCVEIGLALATALAHLHQHGLVHRDVKPSNVIFVNGVPKLADIGLVAGADDTMTFVGTEGYIPPEGPGTPSADCYALGKVLYELSSGRNRDAWSEPPADLATRPDRKLLLELNAIIHRACAPNLQERYRNSEAMLSEFESLKKGTSVKSKRALSKLWVTGKKIGVALIGVVLAAVLLIRLMRGGGGEYPRSPIDEVNQLVDQGSLAVRSELPDRERYALECFNKAIELDPKFVPAHFGVATVYIHLLDAEHMAQLRETAKTLMKLDPYSAEAWHIQAFIKWRDGRYREALADAERGTQLRAHCRDGKAWAHGAYGFFLQNTGDAEGALKEYRLAAKLASDEPTIQDHLGHPYLMRSNLVEALKHYQASIDLMPGHLNGLLWKARTLEEMGQFQEAIAQFEHHDLLDEGNPAETKRFYDGLRNAFEQGGARGYWQYRLDQEQKKPSPDLYLLATYHARLGETEKAYEFLERAYTNHYCLENLMFDLCWDRQEPRFKAFTRKVGLTE